MAETKCYEALIPSEPPEGYIEWLKGKGYLQHEYLIYRSEKSKKEVRVHCTACGGETVLPYVEGAHCRAYSRAPFGFENVGAVCTGDDTLCPMCKAHVEARHIGRMGTQWERADDAYFLSVHRLNGPEIALCGWRAWKDTDKFGRQSYGFNRYEAYVTATPKKMVRLTGYYKFISQLVFMDQWQQLGKCMDIWGKCELIYPFNPKILIGSNVENCKLDRYIKAAQKAKIDPRVIGYLRLFQRRPAVENLITSGGAAIVADAIERERQSRYYETGKVPVLSWVNWKEKQPAKMLGLNRDEYAAARKDRWTARDIENYKGCLALDATVRTEDIETIRRWTHHSAEMLNECGVPVMKGFRYLNRQYERAGDKSRIACSTLTDYWNMAAKLGYDLNDTSLRWPKDLLEMHDRVLRLQKEKEDAQMTENIRRRYEDLKQYEWEDDGICIIAPQSQDDLIREGKALHHCVATYAKRHAEGKTTILFIRKTEQPEVSFFTLEIDLATMTVRQNRGCNNCARTEAVKIFEKNWLQHIQTITQKSKTKAA